MRPSRDNKYTAVAAVAQSVPKEPAKSLATQLRLGNHRKKPTVWVSFISVATMVSAHIWTGPTFGSWRTWAALKAHEELYHYGNGTCKYM